MRAHEFIREFKDLTAIAKPQKGYKGQLEKDPATPKRRYGSFASPKAGRTERPG